MRAVKASTLIVAFVFSVLVAAPASAAPDTTTINFDDGAAPPYFSGATRLSEQYAASGVHFAGSSATNGGKILNIPGGGWTLTGASQPNFLALASYGGTGGTQIITLDRPASSVSFKTGSQYPGSTLSATATNGSGTLVDTKGATLSEAMQTVTVSGSGITAVTIVSAADNWVVEDLVIVWGSPDADGDGVNDDVDAFPNDPNETTDTDSDGVGDNGDDFPNDPTRSVATPPVITPTITGTEGSNDWYTSRVRLDWSITDPLAEGRTRQRCRSVKTDKDQAETDYTCSATNADGTTDETVSIKVDSTPPVVTLLGVDRRVGVFAEPSCVTTDALSGVDQQATAETHIARGVAEFQCVGGSDLAGNVADSKTIRVPLRLIGG